ncbi:uncharacterized protein LOC129572200, partial [Sitodiplosis mosellana]|uniref:uncharacterized protein LOC129572200 n=1 Tax=Sitodiplosis mosellana TaxID=263140 RepID=UPI0024450FCC
REPTRLVSNSTISEVFNSIKGVHRVIYHDGFKYRYDKKYKGVEYYTCDCARKNGCKCRLHKLVGEDDPAKFELKHSHSHPGDARNIGKQQVHTKIKELAKTTDRTATAIVAESVQSQKKSTLAALPSAKSMVKTVYRERKPGFRRSPETLAELVLDGELRQTKDGKEFLLFDSETEEGEHDRTLIFATEENIHFLRKCEQWFMDGTFSITPPLFKQVYMIHGERIYKIFNRTLFVKMCSI